MRLLYYTSDEQLAWTDDLFGDDKVPPYAILSHTWDEGQEITFEDLKENLGKDKTGYNKIRFCASQAKRDDLHHFWIDTCCIDKSNNVELSEAIISMFRWYKNAERCYVYLSDVSSRASGEDGEAHRRRKAVLAKSRWFTRGWTLQELLAPASVEFFNKEGERLGDKTTLAQTLHEITGIAVQALKGSPMTCFSVEERISWAKGRNTKREEDKAYALLGIFEIQMPPLYGEGQKSAWSRLQKEIQERYFVNLPIAASASFNSRNEEHNARCLTNTRTELLNDIASWAQDRNSKPMFWLSGMAGTGKSTIARTVAQSFADCGQLGASFFFKKGESERSNASKFFTTIANDLVAHEPAMLAGIRQTLIDDPAIAQKTLEKQFEKLVLQPLSRLSIQEARGQTFARVVVIDALDECEQEQDARVILQLLARTKTIQPVPLRIFVTSRPELQIRLGFQEISKGTYQDLVLHEVPRSIVVHDIRLFLEHELGAMRKERGLAADWPAPEQVIALVKLAVPLFIYAATVCRYVGTKGSNPIISLQKVLQYRKTNFSQLDLTYLSILNQLLVEQEEDEEETWLRAFQELVGSIVVLKSPLSISSIGRLLQISPDEVKCRLDSLHSVLDVPDDKDRPIRLLHLSFRECLLDVRKKGKTPFWVDEKSTHRKLASHCLKLMSKPGNLRRNMSNLSGSETLRNEVDQRTVDNCVPPDLHYACRFWVSHLEQSQQQIFDGDTVHVFLQEHLLHWIEAISLMNASRHCVDLLESLHALVAVGRFLHSHLRSKLTHIQQDSSIVSSFIQDAQQFVEQVQFALSVDPSQIYCSAFVFAPETSLIRQAFADHVSHRVQMLSKIASDWDAYDSGLEGHSEAVNIVVFSPNGQLVATASYDNTVRIWEAATGVCRSTLEGHLDSITGVAFSPDGQLVASVSWDKTLRLWEASTGTCRCTLEGHLECITGVAFSPDGQLVASGSWDKTTRLWETATGKCRGMLEGHADLVGTVVFAPDGQLVASGSWDKTVRLWETTTGTCRYTLEGHSYHVTVICFSPDGQLVASGGAWDGTIRLWEAATGMCRNVLECPNPTRALAFSPDGLVLHTDECDISLPPPSAVTSSSLPKQSSDIQLQRQWILRNQQRLLWIPIEHLVGSSAVYDNIVCLGLTSGCVILLKVL